MKQIKKTITLPIEAFSKFIKEPDPKFIKAAENVVKTIDIHFDPKKKNGWDLDYTLLVQEVFTEATGLNLETYLLNALVKKSKYKKKLCLQTSKNGNGLVIHYKKEKK